MSKLCYSSLGSNAIKNASRTRQQMALLQTRTISEATFQAKSRADILRLQHKVKEHDADFAELPPTIRRYLFYHKGRPLLEKGSCHSPVLLDHDTSQKFHPNLDHDAIFLRFSSCQRRAVFAISVPPTLTDEAAAEMEKDLGGEFSHLRLGMLLAEDPEVSSLLSQGFSLLKWHRKTRFCASCGNKTERNAAGNRRTCVNKAECGIVYYPPTSPVGIVLLASTDHSKVVLVRTPIYPPGMFSCIAGFVDVGETLFDAVQREVAEEAGIVIRPETADLQLLGSQHWPFPNGSLMLGCRALVEPEAQPKIDHHGEIEDARWFGVDEVTEALKVIDANPNLRMGGSGNQDELGGHQLFVPPKGALANFLLKTWLKQEHNIVV